MKNAYTKYISSLLLFGTNGLIASMIHLPSTEIVFLRTMIGSIFLIVLFCLTNRRAAFFHHKKQFLFLCISGIATGISWIFLYEAYQQIGVGVASLMYYCGPIIVMMLSPILFRERLTVVKLSGFLIVLAGLFLINRTCMAQEANLWGLFCGAMSAVLYAGMIIFNKKAKDITGLENSMLQLTISFLTVAVFLAFRWSSVMPVARGELLPVTILGLVNTGLGCYLYFSPLAQLPVQTVSVCGYLEPLSAVIFSVLFLRESMDAAQVLGAVLILGGAVFVEWGQCLFSHKKIMRGRYC